MIAFIGLGNTGAAYTNTKHNAGFWVLDELAKRYNLSFQPGEEEYIFVQHKQKKMILAKPTSGMNNSGNAVKHIAHYWGLLPSDIHVVVDDVDIPLGKIRIRPKGGDGSHRGMKNIIYHLQSEQFPRIRLGIGTSENMRPSEKYVLKPFHKDYQHDVRTMIVRGADALEDVLFSGLNHAMNYFNS